MPPLELESNVSLWLSAVSQYKARVTFCSYSVMEMCTKGLGAQTGVLRVSVAFLSECPNQGLLLASNPDSGNLQQRPPGSFKQTVDMALGPTGSVALYPGPVPAASSSLCPQRSPLPLHTPHSRGGCESRGCQGGVWGPC